MNLLEPDEPAPFETVGVARPRPIVFVCDHAGRRMPRRLDHLGLEERHWADHIAWDVGAAAVARALVERFDASGVLAVYSRLVVDLNRDLDDASAFPALSGGVLVPGNLGLSAAAKGERARALYEPYHAAVDAALDRARTRDTDPVLVAVHSFTPRMHGVARPWHVGVLWDKDPRLALRLLAALRAQPGVVAGDNEPYSGRHPADYTIDHHAEPRGIAHVSIEIRQDLIRDEGGQRDWAERVATALRGPLEDERLYRARTPAGPGAAPRALGAPRPGSPAVFGAEVAGDIE
ncbi:MAG TPA: N-formylglutamate amidohydrolase [Gammaproteobacteria bacterium]|nr:N-formylglutamate amidohydrolase [Gammaproteobacteria bacterium]